MPPEGCLSACFNTASTSIGAGIIGLPAAFSSVAIGMTTMYLILITAETVYSMNLLVKVSRKTGLSTCEEMATNLFHRDGTYFVAALRFVHCSGACIAYVVTIGDLVTRMLGDLIEDHTKHFRTQKGTWLIQTILFLVFFLPLTLPRQISNLRYVSTAGIFFMLFFCFRVIAHAGTNGLKADPRPSVSAAKSGNGALSGLGVFIFSYMTQVNAVEISAVMAPKRASLYALCVTLSIGMCGLLYFLVGLLGYLDFAYQLFGVDQMTVAFWKRLIVTFSIALLSLIGGLFVPNVGMVFGLIGGFCGGFIAFILPALFSVYSGNWNVRSVGVVNYVCTYLTLIAGVVAVVCGTASTMYDAVSE